MALQSLRFLPKSLEEKKKQKQTIQVSSPVAVPAGSMGSPPPGQAPWSTLRPTTATHSFCAQPHLEPRKTPGLGFSGWPCFQAFLWGPHNMSWVSTVGLEHRTLAQLSRDGAAAGGSLNLNGEALRPELPTGNPALHKGLIQREVTSVPRGGRERKSRASLALLQSRQRRGNSCSGVLWVTQGRGRCSPMTEGSWVVAHLFSLVRQVGQPPKKTVLAFHAARSRRGSLQLPTPLQPGHRQEDPSIISESRLGKKGVREMAASWSSRLPHPGP